MTTPIITKENVINYSNSWKRIAEIDNQTKFDVLTIQLRALNFLKFDCLGPDCYDKERKAYICKPFTIKGKEAIIKNKKGAFNCNCKTFKNLPEIDGLVCQHILALKLQLKIWNNERKRDKEEFWE